MKILLTLFKVVCAGTMSVYPRTGMYGSGILQSLQSGYRLGLHFGIIKPGHRAIAPGPLNEQGKYIWFQDLAILGKNIYPLIQRAISSK